MSSPNSPCTCQTTPCGCDPGPLPVCPPVAPCTKCDLYRVGDKNVWVERGDGPNDGNCPGICLLDTMSEDQVIYSLEHDDKAKEDLLKVTSDPRLVELAQTIPRLPDIDEADAVQADLGRDNAGAIPFYAIFRGQPPFAQ